MTEGIRIAHIVRYWGNKGEVTADILTDFPDRFDDVAAVTLRRGVDERGADLDAYRFHKGRVLLKFAGVDSISDAERLAGYDVMVPEDELHELPEDEDVYYAFQLADCMVETTEGEQIGTVSGVLSTGGGDLLSVKRPGRDEALIPFVDEICVDVDLANKRIVVDPPVGLLDL
jgi:16S rRNA processing protein RimM